MNALGTCTHAHSTWTDTKLAARTPEVISITPDSVKSPNLPNGAETRCRGKADGSGNCENESTMSGDMQRSDNGLTTAKNASRRVKTSQIRPSMQNSSNMLETEMAKHPGQCMLDCTNAVC